MIKDPNFQGTLKLDCNYQKKIWLLSVSINMELRVQFGSPTSNIKSAVTFILLLFYYFHIHFIYYGSNFSYFHEVTRRSKYSIFMK